MKKQIVNVEVRRPPSRATPSPRTVQVAIQFGLRPPGEGDALVQPISFDLAPGTLTAIVGPSGCGKSSLLRALGQARPRGIAVHAQAFPAERAVLDVIRPSGDLASALSLMSSCGLGEPRLWIQAFDELSDGERFRARLALAISRQAESTEPVPLFCDEFCSGLHPRLAHAIARNLRKLVTRLRLPLVLAMSRDDLLADLRPDVVARLHGSSRGRIQSLPFPIDTPNWMDALRIEPGGKRDYDAFAQMHYRPSEELGFVDCVFVLRDPADSSPLGIVVYSHPPLELNLRNRATAGRFKRKPHLLNKELRILRRLVIHPDLRGCGLGHYLVRQTLPRVGTPYVECLAGLGTVNPVFEKAGMQRIGQCASPAAQLRALRQVQNFGLDPMSREFVNAVCRRPRIRKLVTDFVAQWYQATTSTGDTRAARQSPEFLARTFQSLIGSRPVYYLWNRKGEIFQSVPESDSPDSAAGTAA